MQVRITDERDPFFHYSMELTEDAFSGSVTLNLPSTISTATHALTPYPRRLFTFRIRRRRYSGLNGRKTSWSTSLLSLRT